MILILALDCIHSATTVHTIFPQWKNEFTLPFINTWSRNALTLIKLRGRRYLTFSMPINLISAVVWPTFLPLYYVQHPRDFALSFNIFGLLQHDHDVATFIDSSSNKTTPPNILYPKLYSFAGVCFHSWISTVGWININIYLHSPYLTKSSEYIAWVENVLIQLVFGFRSWVPYSLLYIRNIHSWVKVKAMSGILIFHKFMHIESKERHD